jgi:hypothetical protein
MLLKTAFGKQQNCRLAGVDRHRKRASMTDAPDFGTALFGFNAEAVGYCDGISESVAHTYATDYARMLQNRARGVEVTQPRYPIGLFEPNRNLIRSTLDRMSEKYFPLK